MRSFGFALFMIFSSIVFVPFAYAGDDDPGDIFATSSDEDNTSATTDEKKSGSSESSETIMDSETLLPRADASGRLIDANFISLGGTAAWLDRNGLGAHFGFGGYTCMREYCNTTLDVQFLGSISLILGAYYRLTPNWSFFADLTIAHLKTNLFNNDVDVSDNRGVAVQFLFGPAFHLPVRGWLDLYTSLGIGPIALREKTSSDYKHRWGGFDIEWSLGANFYFWSVGVLKNFSVGPFIKFGFPIWPKVCVETAGEKYCDRPSNMDDQSMYWKDTPFTFQMGLEARYDFSFTGKKATPVSAESTKMDAGDSRDKSKKDDAKKDKDDDEKKGDGEPGDAAEENGADADVSASGSISL